MKFSTFLLTPRGYGENGAFLKLCPSEVATYLFVTNTASTLTGENRRRKHET